MVTLIYSLTTQNKLLYDLAVIIAVLVMHLAGKVMSIYDIKARFFGKAFANNIYDLQTVRLLTDNVHLIIERLIAIHLGRIELADELKNQIKSKVAIKNDGMEIGFSFERDLYQNFGISGTSFPQANISDEIARIFYSAMMLRKLIAEAKKSKLPAKILLNIENDKTKRSVVKTEKGNILLSSAKVLWAAQMTKDAADSILSIMDGEHIVGFEFDGFSRPFVSNKDDSIVIGQNEDDLVAVASFKGKLDNLFFSKQRGIVVAENEVYQIAWDESSKLKILDHADLDNVEFIAKPCIETHSLYGELIVYKVLDCKAVDYSQQTVKKTSQKAAI